jgi:Uma2 family endonuclease
LAAPRLQFLLDFLQANRIMGTIREVRTMISIRIPPWEIPFDDLLPVRRGDITFEEFVKMVPDGQKADLLDGVIYMASPDNTDAADLNMWLSTLIYSFVELHQLGKVYVSRVAYSLGPKRGPEPDIGFVPKQW